MLFKIVQPVKARYKGLFLLDSQIFLNYCDRYKYFSSKVRGALENLIDRQVRLWDNSIKLISGIDGNEYKFPWQSANPGLVKAG